MQDTHLRIKKANSSMESKDNVNKKRHWEPQVAQMPHMNVLDLSVFPCMSKGHSDKSRKSGGLKVLSEAEIWKNAESMWKELPNCKVASGYIQAYRISEKVMKEKGDNKFLGAGGSIHTNVRTDFYETENGLARKDKKRCCFTKPNTLCL
jgi:hypothetical protein